MRKENMELTSKQQRDRLVIALRMRGATLDEVAELIEMPKEQVRQVEAKEMSRLRDEAKKVRHGIHN